MFFLGWYLMTAPFSGLGTARKPDPSAPLAEWHILAPYDSIGECEQRRHQITKSAKTSFSEEKMFACISTDDPRINLGGSLRQNGTSKGR
jgi:hypothetical protein